MTFTRLFTSHPASVGETYLGHMGAALGFARELLAAGGAALVHAFLPFLFVTTASTTVRRLHARLESRARRPAPEPARPLPPADLPGWDPVI